MEDKSIVGERDGGNDNMKTEIELIVFLLLLWCFLSQQIFFNC